MRPQQPELLAPWPAGEPFLTLQICGKCIGGAVRPWSSALRILDSGLRYSGRNATSDSSAFEEKTLPPAADRVWGASDDDQLPESRSAGAYGNKAAPVEDALLRRPSNHKPAAGRRLMRSRQIRRIFFVELFQMLRVVWPILSGVLLAMIGPGLLIGYIERWRIVDAFYFTFVTGLTIGYGDLTPRHVVSRLLAVVIGLAGIVLTGLVAAVSVEALRAAARGAGE